MQGIEIAEKYFNVYGDELFRKFGDLKTRVAIGIAGSGSECLGFDDMISRDHDFSAGFSMWLTDEDFQEYGIELNREYQKLPKDFLGVQIQGNGLFASEKFGAIAMTNFFQKTIGFPTVPWEWQQWFYTPSQNFLEATNGTVFLDELGLFTEIRRQIKDNFPRDVRLKKLSAHLALMAQSGQYNYMRMAKHSGAIHSEIAIHEFIKHSLQVLFLLVGEFAPYYKWQFKTISKIEKVSTIYNKIEDLIMLSCEDKNIQAKFNIIESISADIVKMLKEQQLSFITSDYLENHSVEVLKNIENTEIKELHLMEFGG